MLNPTGCFMQNIIDNSNNYLDVFVKRSSSSTRSSCGSHCTIWRHHLHEQQQQQQSVAGSQHCTQRHCRTRRKAGTTYTDRETNVLAASRRTARIGYAH